MKKQFEKIKIAAESLRSGKSDCHDFELDNIEKQVEKYRDVLEKMVRKLPSLSSSSDAQERDKRVKKNSHYKIGQSLEESSKELNKDMPLQHVLANCGDLEKCIAECIVDSEMDTELEVVRRLKLILDTEIQEISTLKKNVTRTVQEYTSLKKSYEAAIRREEPISKINHIKEQQEQCEVKLEKERDTWAAQMFELIAKEDVIVHCIRDYVLNQRNYHERALRKVNSSLDNIQNIIQSTAKTRFGTSLHEHLVSTNREISYVLELCICCLVEAGIYEEGLLRVGCASTKLRRMKHALEAQHVKTPLPLEYQDPHVIGGILKLYLRELPEPLLTYKYYKDFMKAVEQNSEAERKAYIKSILAKLPNENFVNLRYLTRFLWLVTQNVDHNKMNSQNLAIVMAPNMLWQRIDKNNPTDYMGQVNSSSASHIIVELLINQWDYFFDGEVDFFVTLQRDKLFVEGKSKSNSSNENLDKHDAVSDNLEGVVRYGTLRRQKANAPSPPAKQTQNYSSNNNSHALEISAPIQQQTPPNQKNGDIYANSKQSAKELFRGNGNGSCEKPEKPPLPKQLQLQQQPMPPPAPPSQIQAQATVAETQQQQQQIAQLTPKPVPLTRTQFFGLDQLPSPIADRKSIEKPDLPQKPKIPKRPVVLNYNANSKNSDEEITPTQTSDNTIIMTTTATTNANVLTTTEQFIDKLRNENCDNQCQMSSFGTAKDNDKELQNKDKAKEKEKEKEEKQTAIETNQQNSNANANVAISINDGNATAQMSTSFLNSNANADKPLLTSLEPIATAATSIALNNTNATRTTPTTPVSPNMVLTPKRPTVPAPPPPTIVKKQVD